MPAQQTNAAAAGEEHEMTAKCYMRIGVVYNNQNLGSMALNYYDRSLTIRRTVLGELHKDTAACYNMDSHLIPSI